VDISPLGTARSPEGSPEGLPDEEEMSATSGFLNSMDSAIIVTGEDDDTEWRISG
jgi:hypothetical protein